MRAPADCFVEVNGLRLHYLDWGNHVAPLLLLLHGGTAHARWWDRFAPAVAHDYHVVALDFRGHGDSARADPPLYRLEDYADDVTALVRALGVSHLSIVAHSLGAIVAVLYSGNGAATLDALVLVDIRVRITEGGRRFLERLRYFPHPVYASRSEGIRRFRLLPSATAASAEILAHVAGHGLRDLPDGRCTPKFDRAALSDAAPRDVCAELAQLRCPILYLRGTKSVLVSHDALAEVKTIVPHAHTAEIADAYHHVMLDNPQGFERAVGDFLAAVRRERAAKE